MSGNGWYDVAQICANGHLITAIYNQRPEDRRNFCSTCGAETLIACRSCDAPILGAKCWRVSNYATRQTGVSFHFPSSIPGHCTNCGKPYPWTAAIIMAATELADELEGLADDDRITLKENVGDLLRDTPRTEVAATKFRNILKRSGTASLEAFKAMLINVITEAAKRSLFPPS